MAHPIQRSPLCLDCSSLELPEGVNAHDQLVFKMGIRSANLRVATILVEPLQMQGPVPVIIFNRGGNQAFGSITAKQIAAKLIPLSRAGYIVIASQYRGGVGSEGNDEFGGSDLDDVLVLRELLAFHPHADLNRIGMIGESRGGMMTYLSLRKVDWISAAVTIGGLADLDRAQRLRPEMAEVYEKRFGGAPAAIMDRSALQWPERFCKLSPLLMLHGTADWRVSPVDTLELSQAFIREKVPHRAVIFEGGDHGLSEYRQEATFMTMSWLQKYVTERQSWPSLEPHGP